MIPMRIVIASDLHWPTISGVATFGRNLAQGMAGRGHEVLVIAPSQTGWRYEERDVNHRVMRTRSLALPFYQGMRISPTPYSEVKRIIAAFKPDIIHIQTPLGVGRAGRNVGKKLGISVVATNHGMPENLIENLRMLAPFARPLNYIIKELGERFYSGVDYVTMPTEAAIKMFQGNTEDARIPIRAVSNGIDLSRFNPGEADPVFMQKFGLPTNRPIIGYVGRLDGEKHVYVLVEAIKRLLEHMPVHLVVVGSGNDAENLQNLAQELGLNEHVTFTGRISDEDLVAAYHAFTVQAMPSPAELQCLAVLEGMASGLPVVAVNAGALYELCRDGQNGYLCEVDSDADMADKLYRILADDKVRNRMAAKSLAIAKTHDLAYTLDQFEGIYRDLAGNHR
jgi:glycosyltransferase involved in cell wall biosynthesis